MNYFSSSNSKLINIKEWDDFVYKHPNANYFQSSLYYQFIETLSDSEPFIIYVSNDNNEIAGLLLAVFQLSINKTQNSSRCIIYGGPLVNDVVNTVDIYSLLLKELVSIYNKECHHYEIRNLFNQEKFISVFQEYEFELQEHLNIIINTFSTNKSLINISKTKIRQFENSISNGAELIEAQNIEQVKEFYFILENLYNKKVKKTLPDWEFFKNFYALSQKSNCGKYFLVQYMNKIIGGIMCPIFNSKIIYEWYICGLDKQFKGIHPSIIATYGTIEYAKNNNFKCFDFMGAGKPNVAYGVRTFKKQFGGEMVNFGRYIREV